MSAEVCVPLEKLGPVGIVGNTIIVEAIKAAAPDLSLVVSHKGLEARVNLDARDDARHLQQIREGGAVSDVLVECLLAQALRA